MATNKVILAIANGANDSPCKLQLLLYRTTTAKGAEKNVYASVSVSGKPTTVQEAVDLLAVAPSVKWSIPVIDEGQCRLRLPGIMSGSRAAALVAHFGGYNLPASIDDDTYAAHLTACGVTVETTPTTFGHEREESIKDALAETKPATTKGKREKQTA